MILWYATPEFRWELIVDFADTGEMLEELAALARQMITEWVPTTPNQHHIVKHGRQVEWLVWQLAMMSESPERTSSWTQDDEMLEPWGIAIATLPRYPGIPGPILAPPEPAPQPPL